MAEKIVGDLLDLALEDELNVELASGKDFLEALSNKVRQLGREILDVEFKIDKKLLFFSIETKKINDELFAQKVIKLIDNLTYEFFFQKSKNLSQSNWCAKYMLFSSYISSHKVQSLQFTWFKNLFRHKICPCFICESYYTEAQCRKAAQP